MVVGKEDSLEKEEKAEERGVRVELKCKDLSTVTSTFARRHLNTRFLSLVFLRSFSAS